MFTKVLVANRGEIAVRIIRSLQELGIQTVAIYSTADRDSLHVQLADEAVCVGPAQPQESYLNMQNIIAAAVGVGAQAIHPGYGFLAENAEFANLCTQCGLTFIGPRATTIDLMGNKEHARQEMRQNGIPVVPGSKGRITTLGVAQQAASELGYPIMLKAIAGGGGKGIRRVESEQELERVFTRAQKEALLSFGDQGMYLEKILTGVRHIEVQVFADHQGNQVYFPERDCSVQRNKQKLVEESPAPGLTSAERKYLGRLALRVMDVIAYTNTGTIEFLMDQDHHFYFIEMNTRLQVEHTVTEMITGIDLVKEQVRVAAGLPLSFTQDDIQAHGHAIECRINAEDPTHDFRPAAGQVTMVHLPAGNLGVRIDTALYPGDVVTPFYDSLIAKVIAQGSDREEARAKAQRLVNELVVRGVTTNQALQQAILADPLFVGGQATITTLEKEILPAWKGTDM